MSSSVAKAGGAGALPPAPSATPRKSVIGTRPWVAALFLLPALVLLGALVVYPIGYSVWRSLYDSGGSHFVGVDNYVDIFRDDQTLIAVRNTAIWVAVAPALCTALGLIFAVLTERVRWGTAFKLIVFMPMAISMLAAGIIFRLVYEQDPNQGAANAIVTSVHDAFTDASVYPKARPAIGSDLKASGGGSFTTKQNARAGTPAFLPLVGIAPDKVPGSPQNAKAGEHRGRQGHRHGLAGLQARRRRHEGRRRRGREGPEGRQGGGGARRQGRRVHHQRRRRHLHPAQGGGRRPTPAAGARTSRPPTTASSGSARPW